MTDDYGDAYAADMAKAFATGRGKPDVKETPAEWDGESPITDTSIEVQTRDGRKVRLAGNNFDARPFVIVGWVLNEDDWEIYSWTQSGGYFEGKTHVLDLIPIPKTVVHEAWLNLYPNKSVTIYSTEELAKFSRSETCIETRKITWEVPQ